MREQMHVLRDVPTADGLKRSGAAAERRGILLMLEGLKRRYEMRREVHAASSRRVWYGRRIEFLSELIALVTARGPAPASSSSGAADLCTECGRTRPRGARWVSCTTCEPGEDLVVCPDCVPAHQGAHLASGDAPPAPSWEPWSESEQSGPEIREFSQALDEFDQRVEEIMGRGYEDGEEDTRPLCARCGRHIEDGRCWSCTGGEGSG